MPDWSDENLETHYKKHPNGKNQDCWMDVLKQTTPVTKDSYEAESKRAFNDAWLEYLGSEFDPDSVDFWNKEKRYHDERIYCVDRRLILDITTTDKKVFISCFHIHFDLPHEKDSTRAPKGENEVKFLNWLERNGWRVKITYANLLNEDEISEDEKKILKERIYRLENNN